MSVPGCRLPWALDESRRFSASLWILAQGSDLRSAMMEGSGGLSERVIPVYDNIAGSRGVPQDFPCLIYSDFNAIASARSLWKRVQNLPDDATHSSFLTA